MYIDILTQNLQTVCPDWEIYFHDKPLMNVIADTIEGRYYKPILADNFMALLSGNYTPILNNNEYNPLFIFIEEPKRGMINHTLQGLPYLSYDINIFFCTLVAFEGLAIDRQTIRETMIQKAIIPFLYQFNDYINEPYYIEQPEQMFDANEVSVKLTIQYKQPICGL